VSVLALKNTQTTFFVREGNLVRHFFLNCGGQKKRIKKIPNSQSVLALKNTQTTFFVREGNLVRHFFLNCEGQKKRIKKIPDFQVFWFTFLIDKSKSSENEYL
jgi:hypothetical protein